MYERFTDRARKVMQLANQEAQRFKHEYIGTEHILLGLVKEGSGVAANVLKNLDIDLGKIRAEVEKIVLPGPEGTTMGKLPQTPRAKKVIEFTIEEARNLNHDYVGTEHLLLGLLREEEGVAAQVLMNLGLRLEDVREEVLNLLGHDIASGGKRPGEKNTQRIAQRTPQLDLVGSDLTAWARHGNLDPVIGRHQEKERLVLVFFCRTQNNPLLVGEPGSGKTSIVKGLAHWIAEGLQIAPERRIVALNLARMVARLGPQGGFQQYFATVMKEIRDAKNIILFLNDLHFLACGPSRGKYLYAGDLLKSALSQGEIQCIGATTPEKYYSELVHDDFFGRLFRPIRVKPTSPDETLAILRGKRHLYEEHHQVQIGDEALEAAVELSDFCISDRCLPGKAIHLLDEACALVRLRNVPPRPDFKEIDGRLEQLRLAKDAAVSAHEFERAAQIHQEELRLKDEKEKLASRHAEARQQVIGNVDKNSVAEVVSKMTGMPAGGSTGG
jgi:ATP-dependent Clp protease ATP-binding subunit ClpC